MISVIVTAFNRKRFLSQALGSIVNQTLNRSEYEVIVVKNFTDEVSDTIIRQHGYKEILCDNPNQGIHYTLALKECKGDIICPLDDDDMFYPKRLEIIKQLFLNIKDLGYIWNSFSAFNGDQPIIDENPMRSNNFRDVLIRNIRSSNISQASLPFVYNSSSMAIKKDILVKYFNLLSKIDTQIDIFMFYAAYMADCSVLFTSKILTYYRIHGSNTSLPYDVDEDGFLAKRLRLYRHRVNDWKIIRELCRNTLWEYEAGRAMWEAKLTADLLEAKNRKTIIQSLYMYTMSEFAGIGIDKAGAMHHVKQFIDPSSPIYRGVLGLVTPKRARRLLFLRALNSIKKPKQLEENKK